MLSVAPIKVGFSSNRVDQVLIYKESIHYVILGFFVVVLFFSQVAVLLQIC